MPTDQLVTAADVLRAREDARARGSMALLRELENLEPDLAEHVMNELTELNHRLRDIGITEQQVMRLTRRQRQLVLVSLFCLRAAMIRLLNHDRLD